jgi:hypothetical protein
LGITVILFTKVSEMSSTTDIDRISGKVIPVARHKVFEMMLVGNNPFCKSVAMGTASVMPLVGMLEVFKDSLALRTLEVI